jgi:hypothetical protein
MVMKNNLGTSVFLSVSMVVLTTLDFQVVNTQKPRSINLEASNSSPLILARVVHDPEDSKTPPPP